MLRGPGWSPWGAQSLLALGGKDAPPAGRPVTALSFLADRALAPPGEDGLPDPQAFHRTNLAIHLLAGLALWALLRASLRRMAGLRPAAETLAAAVSLLWLVHPLHVGTVTYVSQRSEALAALLMLLSLLCLERAGRAETGRGWAVGTVAAGLLAVGSKEIGAALPLLALLYDRAFLAGSFRAALERRGWLHAGLLVGCWGLLAALLLSDPRPESVAWSWRGITPLNYLLTQARAIGAYLGWVAWPEAILLDHGWPIVPVRGPGDLLPALPRYGPALVLVGGLFGLTACAQVRHPRAGFPAAAFFLILAPSSSVLPVVTEIVAPHRMYLPSAMVLTLGVVGAWRLISRGERFRLDPGRAGVAVLGISVALAVGLGAVTWRENRHYASEIDLWRHHLALDGANPRTWVNLGAALERTGALQEAEEAYVQAIAAAERIELPRRPGLAEALAHLAGVRLSQGHWEPGMALLEKAIEEDPTHGRAHERLAAELVWHGRPDEALRAVERALASNPDLVEIHLIRASARLQRGELDEARRAMGTFLGEPPGSREVTDALAGLARRIGRADLSLRLEAQRGADPPDPRP